MEILCLIINVKAKSPEIMSTAILTHVSSSASYNFAKYWALLKILTTYIINSKVNEWCPNNYSIDLTTESLMSIIRNKVSTNHFKLNHYFLFISGCVKDLYKACKHIAGTHSCSFGYMKTICCWTCRHYHYYWGSLRLPCMHARIMHLAIMRYARFCCNLILQILFKTWENNNQIASFVLFFFVIFFFRITSINLK